jgi:Uma2 family endonuclease
LILQQLRDGAGRALYWREIMGVRFDKRLFTVDDCYRMSEAGIIRPDERLNRVFVRLTGETAITRIQGTAALDEWYAPQPDLALLRPRKDFYERRHARASEVLLIVEVADSSYEFDTTIKKESYAILGVREYWVVDLERRRLLVHRDPKRDSYNTLKEFHSDDTVAPKALPACRIRVGADIFGARPARRQR